MAVLLSPYGGVGAQFLDNSGNVLTGGKIYTYAAGTTTPQATYISGNGATVHSNPIILDAAGRVPGGEIWLTDGLVYKFVLKDSNDVLIATYDGIVGINSNFVSFVNQQEIQTATAGQTVFNLTTMTYQPGTNSLSVFVDGVNQYGPGSSYAYLETDSDTVTFVTGLHVGAEVKFTTSNLNSSASVNDAEQVSYIPPFTGSVATNVEAKLAQTVSVQDFGAVGDYTTDDSNAIAAALSAVAQGGEVFFPRGVYRVTRSFDLPLGVKLRGVGRPTMQIAPIYEDDKRYLRPGYKHMIPGSTIIFDGTQTLTKATSRTDRFSSFGYALGTTLDYPNEISNMGLIMDMDVFDAAGNLTTPSTDNRSNYDSCLLINDSPLCNISNVCMFGYWSKSCVTVVSQDSMANPDYNFFTNCEMVGDIGVALIGSMVVNPSAEGLSGSIFVNCKINDRTHHDRTQTNVAELGTNVIFVDGITSVSTMIAGHKFIGCSLRGTVEVPINLDQADSFSLIGCVTEFTNNSLYAPATSKFIVGTANTRGVSLSGNRVLGNGANIQRLAGQIRGPLVVDEDDDGASFLAKFGKGVCFGPFDELSNDPTIQLTTDFTGGTRGWNIRYSVSSGLLNLNFNNTNVANFDQTGNITPAGRLTKILGATTRQSHTIAAGVITINGTSSYLSIATEGGAATDDLDTINGGEIGDILIVTAFSGSNTVVLKDGTGNLRLASDFSLDNAEDTITLMKNVSGNWVEICRSDNGA